eukprot:4142666-Pleurochrysis_carterae.AAC.2
MVKCFRLALPHGMSLPAVRLYLAGLPPEPSTGPLDGYPIAEAWSHALRDPVPSSIGAQGHQVCRVRRGGARAHSGRASTQTSSLAGGVVRARGARTAR